MVAIDGFMMNPDHCCKFSGTIMDFKPYGPNAHLFMIWGRVSQGDKHKNVKGLQLIPLATGHQYEDELDVKGPDNSKIRLRQWQVCNKMRYESFQE